MKMTSVLLIFFGLIVLSGCVGGPTAKNDNIAEENVYVNKTTNVQNEETAQRQKLTELNGDEIEIESYKWNYYVDDADKSFGELAIKIRSDYNSALLYNIREDGADNGMEILNWRSTLGVIDAHSEDEIRLRINETSASSLKAVNICFGLSEQNMRCRRKIIEPMDVAFSIEPNKIEMFIAPTDTFVQKDITIRNEGNVELTLKSYIIDDSPQNTELSFTTTVEDYIQLKPGESKMYTVTATQNREGCQYPTGFHAINIGITTEKEVTRYKIYTFEERKAFKHKDETIVSARCN